MTLDQNQAQRTCHLLKTIEKWLLKLNEKWLKIKICLHGGKYADSPREIGTNYTQYFERSYYIGEMQAQTLVKVETLEKIRQNYNFEILSRDEISEQVRAYNTALAEAEKIKSLLPNFLKY